MKKSTMAYVMVMALVAIVAYWAGTSGRNGPSPLLSHGNVFVGHIVDQRTHLAGPIGANVLTDEGCQIDPHTGLSNCTSQMSTPSGTLSFNYEHDMMAQPCLSEGDTADINVLANGTAVVTRTYWGGGGA